MLKDMINGRHIEIDTTPRTGLLAITPDFPAPARLAGHCNLAPLCLPGGRPTCGRKEGNGPGSAIHVASV